MTFRFSIFNLLSKFALGLIFLDLLGRLLFFPELYTSLFSLQTEKNFPTIFSTIILGLAAFLLFACYRQDFSKRFNPKYWLFLSVIFFQLSLDEWFSIHDPLGKFIGRLFFPSLDKLFGWTFVYLFFCIILLLFLARFLLRLPRRTAVLMVLSGFIFVSGAIGFEYISNKGLSYVLPFFQSYGLEPYLYLLPIIEESLEMFGVILFINVLTSYLITYCEVSSVTISKRVLTPFFVIVILDFVISQIVFFS